MSFCLVTGIVFFFWLAKVVINFDIYKYISKNLGFLRNLILWQQKQERNHLANLHQNGRKKGNRIRGATEAQRRHPRLC